MPTNKELEKEVRRLKAELKSSAVALEKAQKRDGGLATVEYWVIANPRTGSIERVVASEVEAQERCVKNPDWSPYPLYYFDNEK